MNKDRVPLGGFWDSNLVVGYDSHTLLPLNGILLFSFLVSQGVPKFRSGLILWSDAKAGTSPNKICYIKSAQTPKQELLPRKFAISKGFELETLCLKNRNPFHLGQPSLVSNSILHKLKSLSLAPLSGWPGNL